MLFISYMGKVQCFEVVYENGHGVFRAGQTLSAKLLLELTEMKKVEAVRVHLKGKAKTSWSNHHGKTFTHYGDEEVYFDQQLDTHYADRYPNKVIPAGRHEITFTFQLPPQLPSSYEGLYGHIRYVCTGVLERSWKFDIACKRPFTVIAQEDLNNIPGISTPVRINETQEIFCCCLKRGTVNLRFVLPKRGYVPGEMIPIGGEVINNSSKSIDHVLVRLKQYVTFKGKTMLLDFDGAKETKLEAAGLEWPTSIRPGQTELVQLRLQVPSVPPRLVGCKIIDINYLLKFNVGSWIRCSLPIVIGTVPLRPRFLITENSSHSVFGPTAESPSTSLVAPWANGLNGNSGGGVGGSGDLPPPYVETPPPSYRECVLGAPRAHHHARRNRRSGGGDLEEEPDDEDSLDDEIGFVPKYCYYGLL